MKTFINASIFLAKKLTKKLESIVFPPCCAICGKLNSKKCCKDCEKRINSQLNLNIKMK